MTVSLPLALLIFAVGQRFPLGPELKWIKPIGFSSGGALAYVEENPRCNCQGGRCVERIPLCGYNGEAPENCEERCRRAEGVIVDLKNDAILRREAPEAIQWEAHGIVQQQLAFVALPHRSRGNLYTIELSHGCEQIADLDGNYDEVHECAVYLKSDGKGRKRIHVFRSTVLRGFQLIFQGALFSPSGTYAAFLFMQSHKPFESEGPQKLFFVGANLSRGFQHK